MGPLSADTQPPPSSADSAWFLKQNSGFGLHDDETGLPPLNPPGSSNRKPQRNSDLDFRLFAVSKTTAPFSFALGSIPGRGDPFSFALGSIPGRGENRLLLSVSCELGLKEI